MWLLPAGARRAAVAFLFAAFFATLAITPGDAARPASQPQNAFVVWAILDLASGWTSLGRASRVTLQLAETDANATLARQGARLRVRLRVVDARGEPAIALRQLRRLARDRVRIVVGPEKSSEVAAVRRAATSLGVLVISQGSTAHSLAEASDNVFRFVPDDLREGEAVVALLRHDGIDAIVPVWRRDAGNTASRARCAGSSSLSAGRSQRVFPTRRSQRRSTRSGRRSPARRLCYAPPARSTSAFTSPASTRSSTSSAPLDPIRHCKCRGTAAMASRSRLAWSTTNLPQPSRTRSAIRIRPSAYPTPWSDAPPRFSPEPGTGLVATPMRSTDGIRRAANRRRSAAARGHRRRRHSPACPCGCGERARWRHGKDDPEPCRRSRVWELRLLVGLPSPREVPLGSQLRVRRQPRRLGSNSAAHTLLTSNRRSPPSAPTHRFPAPRERGCVESLGGVECPRGPLRCLPAEGPAEHPLASESNKAQPVVGQARSALRGEIQVDRHLLDECRVAWHALRLLESVGHERREHLQFSHPRADGDPDRDRARGNHDPWHLGEAGAPCECADNRHRKHDNALDVVRKCARVGLGGKEPLAIGG